MCLRHTRGFFGHTFFCGMQPAAHLRPARCITLLDGIPGYLQACISTTTADIIFIYIYLINVAKLFLRNILQTKQI
jgi:hypothetical protein